MQTKVLCNDQHSIHSLKQIVGKKLIMGFLGTGLESDTEEQKSSIKKLKLQIAENKLGGVILFSYNIINEDQLKLLISDLKSYIPAGKKFLFSIDFEGGKVNRLSKIEKFKDFPSPKYVTEHYSLEEAEQLYENVFMEIAKLGINVNFAPVVDVIPENEEDRENNIISKAERSFSHDPNVVAKYAAIMIKAMNKNGIQSFAKHFPGHGGANGDTHEDIIDITNSYKAESELYPYQYLIQNNIINGIMTSHLFNRHIDNLFPVTISGEYLKILREKLHFNSVTITDDLRMGAMLRNYGLTEIIINTIKNGHDFLIYSNNINSCKNSNIPNCIYYSNIVDDIYDYTSEAINDDETLIQLMYESGNRIDLFLESII